jgi:hypothetical protein
MIRHTGQTLRVMLSGVSLRSRRCGARVSPLRVALLSSGTGSRSFGGWKTLGVA